MNASVAPFDNPKVRQAVNLGYRTPTPGRDVRGAGADQPRPAAPRWALVQQADRRYPGLRRGGVWATSNIAKAKALLAEAGHPDGFEVETMFRQARVNADQAAIYKEQLRKIDIELALKLGESATGSSAI